MVLKCFKVVFACVFFVASVFASSNDEDNGHWYQENFSDPNYDWKDFSHDADDDESHYNDIGKYSDEMDSNEIDQNENDANEIYPYQHTNQPFNQPINQPINQLINQSITQPSNNPSNQPLHNLPQSLHHSTERHQNSMPTGCSGAGLCCQGKDNNCVTKGTRMNGSNNDTCYCDSTCLPLGDCCTDYTDHCREVKCVLSEWGRWSSCDVACGFGTRQRERSVIQEARNGATVCDATTQKQVCEGRLCKKTRDSGSSGEELRETARILALEYGEWREVYKYDPLKDIRRNIYHHLGHNSSHRSLLTYCGVYRMEYVQASCRHIKPPSPPSEKRPQSPQPHPFLLESGTIVCVECQHTAINDELGGRCYGHGVVSKVTKWTTLGSVGCMGSWVLQERKPHCSCGRQYSRLPGYIFV